jgi:hypothetical protein
MVPSERDRRMVYLDGLFKEASAGGADRRRGAPDRRHHRQDPELSHTREKRPARLRTFESLGKRLRTGIQCVPTGRTAAIRAHGLRPTRPGSRLSVADLFSFAQANPTGPNPTDREHASVPRCYSRLRRCRARPAAPRECLRPRPAPSPSSDRDARAYPHSG